MTFTVNGIKYEVKPAYNGCEGCSAEFNKWKCAAISDYVASQAITGCTGVKGRTAIYKEVKEC